MICEEEIDLDTKYPETLSEIFDTETGSDFMTPEYTTDPIIQKLLREQEEMNRFRDICNLGISYGLYHNG